MNKITLNGRNIDTCNLNPHFHGNAGLRLLRNFFKHLKTALIIPRDFKFDSYTGVDGANKWLQYHKNRLGIDSFNGLYILYEFDGKTINSSFYVENIKV